MKKNIIGLAVASCFAFGASVAMAQPAITPAMEADKAVPFSGKGLNTPWNCCKQYEGQSGERDQPAQKHAPGAKINHSQAQSFKVDPGYKNDDGNRLPEFRRPGTNTASSEPTDTAKYGAGRDAATTGNPAGTGDTLGKSHFDANSHQKQWISNPS